MHTPGVRHRIIPNTSRNVAVRAGVIVMLTAGRSLPLRAPAHNPPGPGWCIALLSVGYLAGLRWEEILNLKWADLRFTSKPAIRIRNQKAGRFDYVPVNSTLTERLKAWMNANPTETVADDKLVFPLACHSRAIRTTWVKLQKWAQVKEPFRFHDLRVSFCTNLVAAGVQAPVLMKLARHRSIVTTMKYYRGKTEDAERNAVEMMETAFSATENGKEKAAEDRPTGERKGESVLQS